MLNEKSVLNVDPHSFQPFNLPFQMSAVIRVNLPTLISNYVFSIGRVCRKFKKLCPRESQLTRINTPILTSNYVFSNKEGLERIERFVFERKSINKEVPNFQDTQEKYGPP